jgi:hypothetical protein
VTTGLTFRYVANSLAVIAVRAWFQSRYVPAVMIHRLRRRTKLDGVDGKEQGPSVTFSKAAKGRRSRVPDSRS